MLICDICHCSLLVVHYHLSLITILIVDSYYNYVLSDYHVKNWVINCYADVY